MRGGSKEEEEEDEERRERLQQHVVTWKINKNWLQLKKKKKWVTRAGKVNVQFFI